ncbi:DUF2493 domain-containing protein [Hymenobacter sp. ASUV-10]|uniref:DUF2493 domain-containing protein n=1 Tax=Hymenobacter aranciens TaxID=3063996 RepID=A0ABT9B9F5_9BACT|nr:DUF2493 domain-containing protein [Hymenobacter sp. ASUV-10]MDO7874359.1 DUF2493 domain-containing protein [Hymenobacter sp. ASUV-10]
MHLAVIGSRHFADYAFLAATLDGLQVAGLLPVISTIVSGGARGADALAARYARERGLPLVEFTPDYARYGRRAPLVRNQLIVDAAEALVAFHDGLSRGTRHALRQTRRRGLKPIVVRIPDAEGLPE